MKYFNAASVLYMFLTLGVKGMNDIRLISRPIYAPNHELEDTDSNTTPTKAISKRTLLSYWALENRVLYTIYGVWTL